MGLVQLALDLFDPPPPPPPPAAPPWPRGGDEARGRAPFVPAVPLADAMAPARFMHPRANRETQLGAAWVGYEFVRGQRRTIGFSVGPEGLTVRAPRWVALRDVEAALQEKQAWILRKLAETRQREARQEAGRIDWRDGASLPYLGAPLTLKLDPAHAFEGAGAVLDTAAEGTQVLRMALAQSAGAAQIRDAAQAWLMRQARQLFTERLAHFAPQLGVRWTKLSLSNAATRWGSASADGSIRLNWRLIHFRLPVIDYVVVHELAHLRVMDHSPRFWETVETVVPAWPALRQELNRPLKKCSSNAPGSWISKKRIAQTGLRSDWSGHFGLFAGRFARSGRTYPMVHA
ncbi:M48 family metallopeptidase [Xenophilus sp. Marseille-Q4582]|uniref:M48 family metallopeptidase n=1 Tax=Xenophilus sp. Marseille-Q4582 TaxID=2866600 RepID=UPI00351DA51A